MIGSRAARQLAIIPGTPQALVPTSEVSVSKVASPKRTVETIRAHERPALHFHAIHSHSTMGTTMLKTATTTMTPTLTAVTAPTTTPGACDRGLFISAENPGTALTTANP